LQPFAHDLARGGTRQTAPLQHVWKIGAFERERHRLAFGRQLARLLHIGGRQHRTALDVRIGLCGLALRASDDFSQLHENRVTQIAGERRHCRLAVHIDVADDALGFRRRRIRRRVGAARREHTENEKGASEHRRRSLRP